MKANILFTLFLLVAAAGTGCQDAAPAAAPSPQQPALTSPSTQPAEPEPAPAMTQPAVSQTTGRLLWWGSDSEPTAQQATSPAAAGPSSRPSATVSVPAEQ